MDYTPDDLWDAATAYASTGLLPESISKVAENMTKPGDDEGLFRARKACAFLVMASGVELGFQPMQSLRELSIVKGKVTLGANAMLALLIRAGTAVHWEVLTNEAAVLVLTRPRMQPHREEFLLGDAKRAGLLDGRNSHTWKAYPKAMLRSRCISAAARSYGADLAAGFYTPEEIESIPERKQLERREEPKQLEAPWYGKLLGWLSACDGFDHDSAVGALVDYLGKPMGEWTEKDHRLDMGAYCAAVKGQRKRIEGSKAGAVHFIYEEADGYLACTCQSFRFSSPGNEVPRDLHTCKHLDRYCTDADEEERTAIQEEA